MDCTLTKYQLLYVAATNLGLIRMISLNPCKYFCKVGLIIPILQMWKQSHRDRLHSSCLAQPDFESCVRRHWLDDQSVKPRWRWFLNCHSAPAHVV